MKFKLLAPHYIRGGYRKIGTIVDLDCVKSKDGKYEGKELPSSKMEEYKGAEPGVPPVKQGKEPIKTPG